MKKLLSLVENRSDLVVIANLILKLSNMLGLSVEREFALLV